MKKQGPKYDQDNYKKPRLSLVPFSVLSKNYDKYHGLYLLCNDIHMVLNDIIPMENQTMEALFDYSLRRAGIKPLAVALGYGCSKYYYESWKESFGGDVKRFLEAALRHIHAILADGEEYDNEPIEGYPLGVPHEGAVVFSLMVALKELRDGKES